jgi:ribosomal protein S18 acetylase RimI-like enzyme
VVAHDLSGLPAGVTLRPVTPDDGEFLLHLYATTREEELAPLPWTDAEKAAFLEMQFDAQASAYQGAYPDGQFLVVLLDGDPAGRLYLGRLPGELRLIDVALLPQHRGRRIGTALIDAITSRADRDGVEVGLHVEPWNPAKRLYERLGFETVELRGIYEFMRRPARVPLETAS